jgi:hypothetical protein
LTDLSCSLREQGCQIDLVQAFWKTLSLQEKHKLHVPSGSCLF